MKAIVYRGFGSPDVLRYEEVAKPTPGDNEVLVKVRAASINPLDWKLMKGGPFLARMLLELGKPKLKRPGVDVAGQVEAIGRSVTQFKPGDEVFGTCVGAFAEYATSESAFGMKSVLVAKPHNITFEQAASAPVAAITALQGLRDRGRIQAGHKVLINGAAGGVGTFAVQIAKLFGADVTGVCSARNLHLVRSIGADRVIDYAEEDFTQGERCYDVCLDCVGNHSLSACLRILSPDGKLIMVGAPNDGSMSALLARLTGAMVRSRFSKQKMIFFIAKINKEGLTSLGEFMATGKVTPIIDRSYKLHEAPDAFRYMAEGHARGKVVVTVDNDN